MLSVGAFEVWFHAPRFIRSLTVVISTVVQVEWVLGNAWNYASRESLIFQSTAFMVGHRLRMVVIVALVALGRSRLTRSR